MTHTLALTGAAFCLAVAVVAAVPICVEYRKQRPAKES